jgi:hypothetical protein
VAAAARKYLGAEFGTLIVPARASATFNTTAGDKMPSENNEAASAQNEDTQNPSEKAEAPEGAEAAKKTPLEMVRERQAQMRGQKPASGRGAGGGETAGSTNSFKRRQFNRKAG